MLQVIDFYRIVYYLYLLNFSRLLVVSENTQHSKLNLIPTPQLQLEIRFEGAKELDKMTGIPQLVPRT